MNKTCSYQFEITSCQLATPTVRNLRLRGCHNFVLLVALVLTAAFGPGGRALSQNLPIPRLSPTLYFPDATTEQRERVDLHAEVIKRIQILKSTTDASLPDELEKTEATYAALRRHGAYLKVRRLENIDDRAAEDAESALDTDESVLDAAIQARLLLVPSSAISLLGRFARLATTEHRDASRMFSPDVEHYRGSVTLSCEQAIADAYDHQMDALEKVSGLTAPEVGGRRAAIAQRETVYDAVAPATAELLATLVDAENRDAIAQGYSDAAERKYIELGLSPAIVDRTIATLAKQASVNREYEEIRADHAKLSLSLPTILPAELNLDSAAISPIQFGDARALILEGLRPLGTDYVQRFAQLIDPANGRLDLAGGLHRSHTGTSISAYDAPVALFYSGYDGTLDAIETIVHEGGHAIHRELMNAGGSPIYEHEGPHYLFEGFAEFDEMLVLDHLARTSSDATIRVRALEMLTAELSHDLFDSAEETAFERALYKDSIGKGLLDRNHIDSTYRAAIEPFETWPMSEVGTSRGWIRKSLLFDDPLYLVNYLYATVVAAALFDKTHSDAHFAEKYDALLRRGFDQDPAALLATVGIDWNDPKLADRAVQLFKEKTAELSEAYAKTVKQ